MSTRNRKTICGEPFRSIIEGFQWILDGRWVCINGRPVSPGWIYSWSFITIRNRIQNGVMTKCYVNSKSRPLQPYYNADECDWQ